MKVVQLLYCWCNLFCCFTYQLAACFFCSLRWCDATTPRRLKALCAVSNSKLRGGFLCFRAWSIVRKNAADVMHGFTSSAWTSSLCVAEDYVFGHWEHMHVCCMGLLLWPAAANICVAWVYFFDHNQQLPWLATRSNSCVAWAYFCGH